MYSPRPSPSSNTSSSNAVSLPSFLYPSLCTMSTTVISSKTQQRVRQPAIQLNVPHARAEPQGLPAKTAAASTSPPSDPHYLPTFTPSAPPSTPILYLPRLHPQHHADPPSAGRHPWDRARGGSTPPSAAATLALHKALHRFRPATEDCAHAPFEAAFNWAELALPEDAEAEWFAVAFYSRHAHGAGGRESSLHCGRIS